MTSADARKAPVGQPSVRTQRALVETAVERLESALYRIQTGAAPELAQLDALTSIAASLLRMTGAPDRRVDRLERMLVALTNSDRELYARTDRLDEQIELLTSRRP